MRKKRTNNILKYSSFCLQTFLIFIILALSIHGFASNASAGEEKNEEPQRLWSVMVYYGVYTNRDFGTTIRRWPSDTENDQFVALSVSRHIGKWGRHLTWEVEGLIAEHYGRSGDYRYNYEEFAAFVVLRYHTFPWNRYLKTSFAMGEGISYTTRVPYKEREEAGEDKRRHKFLNYLMAELTFTVPRFPSTSLVYRVHHRSGIFGLIGHQGSNYYCLGMKYNF